MKWFKFYGQDFLTDSKMMKLNPIQRLMWVGLLCMASQTEDGVIEYFDEDNLKSVLGLRQKDIERANGTFEKFKEMNMIKIKKDKIIVINFIKRQEKDLTGAERVKKWRKKSEENMNKTNKWNRKYRAKKKSDKGQDVNAMLTPSVNAMLTPDKNRVDKNRIDKKKKKKEKPSFDFEELKDLNLFDDDDLKIIKRFYKLGYRCERNKAKGKELDEAKELSEWLDKQAEDYNDLDLVEEANNFYEWWKASKRKIKAHKLAYRNWLKQARKIHG